MTPAPATTGQRASSMLVMELNDLLQLDQDAVAAYTLALSALDDPASRDAVRRFKAEHERHVMELTALVREYGGTPVARPHLAGAFKLGVQSASAAGDDGALIAAFKTYEVQARDKYRRAIARQHPPDVQAVLIRAARDEQRHFDWTMRMLAELGVNGGGIPQALAELPPPPRMRRAPRRTGSPLLVTALLVLTAAALFSALRRR